MVIKVDHGICCHCGGCIPICPVQALLLNGHVLSVNLSRCNGCGICAEICPTGALRLVLSVKEG